MAAASQYPMAAAKRGVPGTLLWSTTCTSSLIFSFLCTGPLAVGAQSANTQTPSSSLPSGPTSPTMASTAPHAIEMLAADITYVTSPATTHLLIWWATFLIVVGALGAVAACVLPAYHLCKGRSRHAEAVARAAEINKSMQEMTARLYRTRQQQLQYEVGFSSLLPQLQHLQAAKLDGSQQQGLREGRNTPPPPLLKEKEGLEVEGKARNSDELGAFQVASSPLKGHTSTSTTTATSACNYAFNDAPAAQLSGARDPVNGEAAVADSGGSSELVLSRKHSALIQADQVTRASGGSREGVPRDSSGASQLERNLSSHSIASSNSSTSSASHRHTSVGNLAIRSASIRSLTYSPSPGQLVRAPSVRAFAGMSKVEALRRAWGRPQLHPVPSTHNSSRLTSPGLKREQSPFVVSPGAFDGGAAEIDRNDGVRRLQSSSSSSSSSTNSSDVAGQRMQRSNSSTLVVGAETLRFADARSSPMMPAPAQTPTRPDNSADMTSSASAMKNDTFPQAAESGTTNSAGRENEKKEEGTLKVADSATEVNNDGVGSCSVVEERRRTFDRVSLESQRLLIPAAMSPTTDAIPPHLGNVEEEDLVELGDVAAPHIPGVMEDGRLSHLFTPLVVTDTINGEEDATALGREDAPHTEEEEPDGGTAVSFKSSRFVLVRSTGAASGLHHVEGRPMVVDNVRHSGEYEDLLVAAGSTAPFFKSDGELNGQNVLSQARNMQLDPGWATPTSSPERQRRASPASLLSQNEEYSRLMDSQFQQQL